MPGYYDYVLALIPLTLVGIAGLLIATGWSITAAVPVAAGTSTLLIGHALFVRAPVVRSGRDAGPAEAGPAVSAD